MQFPGAGFCNGSDFRLFFGGSFSSLNARCLWASPGGLKIGATGFGPSWAFGVVGLVTLVLNSPLPLVIFLVCVPEAGANNDLLGAAAGVEDAADCVWPRLCNSSVSFRIKASISDVLIPSISNGDLAISAAVLAGDTTDNETIAGTASAGFTAEGLSKTVDPIVDKEAVTGLGTHEGTLALGACKSSKTPRPRNISARFVSEALATALAGAPCRRGPLGTCAKASTSAVTGCPLRSKATGSFSACVPCSSVDGSLRMAHWLSCHSLCRC
mmetsp:Transcript_23209/g.56471  ORF Transcript_23209/g.56471 Transcript_23209/m.56471 type:complete len:270 (-) Transcript_23209:1207-2016(-)